jgi:hypothetical protein
MGIRSDAMSGGLLDVGDVVRRRDGSEETVAGGAARDQRPSNWFGCWTAEMRWACVTENVGRDAAEYRNPWNGANGSERERVKKKGQGSETGQESKNGRRVEGSKEANSRVKGEGAAGLLDAGRGKTGVQEAPSIGKSFVGRSQRTGGKIKLHGYATRDR